MRRQTSRGARATWGGARATTLAALLLVAFGVGGFLVWRHAGDVLPAPGPADPGPGSRPIRIDPLYAADPSFDPKEPTATVEGLVVDSGLMPVDGATLVLARIRDFSPAADLGLGRTSATEARTSGSGRFRFEQLPPGTYVLSAMAQSRTPAHLGPLALAPGETKTQTIRLTRTGGVTFGGRILDLGGGNVVGAKVRVIDTSALLVPRIFQTTSDESGSYEMYLAPGNYRLLVEADRRAPTRAWFTLARAQIRDLHLMPAARLVGHVVESGSNRPVPDADLWLVGQRPTDTVARDVRSDRNGGFAFSGLEPGTYRIGARKERLTGMSGALSVPEQASIDQVVEVSNGRSIAGRVTTVSGPAVAGARVELVNARPPFERPLLVKAEPDGRFVLEGVLPGLHRLNVTAEGLARSSQELRVTGDLPSLEVKLHPEASVRGRVLTPEARPAEGAAITLTLAPLGTTEAAIHTAASSAADGSFEVRGLPAGELSVAAVHPVQGSATSKGQTLAEGQRASLTLTLDLGSVISGTLKFDDGAPAGGMPIEVTGNGSGLGPWIDFTRADGTFRLTGIPAGAVAVAPSGQGETKNIILDGHTWRAGVNLRVPAGAEISGVVLAPDGGPVAGAEVTAAPEIRPRPAHSALALRRTASGPDGRFTLEHLAAARHTLWAAHPGFAGAQIEGVDPGRAPVRLQFPPEATVSGQVASADGKPIADYTIVVVEPGKTSANPAEAPGPGDTVHDPSGRFFLARLRPGVHELRVETAAGSTAAVAITLSAGEQKRNLRVAVGK